MPSCFAGWHFCFNALQVMCLRFLPGEGHFICVADGIVEKGIGFAGQRSSHYTIPGFLFDLSALV
jgi:hypothetical protein